MTNKFDNLSHGQLADDYGTIDAQIKALEIKKTDLKKELQTRSVTFAAGERYQVSLAEQSTTRLDTAALKEALGADICKEFEKTSLSTVARVKAIAQDAGV